LPGGVHDHGLLWSYPYIANSLFITLFLRKYTAFQFFSGHY
jgi:hypothetical protein